MATRTLRSTDDDNAVRQAAAAIKRRHGKAGSTLVRSLAAAWRGGICPRQVAVAKLQSAKAAARALAEATEGPSDARGWHADLANFDEGRALDAEAIEHLVGFRQHPQARLAPLSQLASL